MMALAERIPVYEQIEDSRGRPLIVYVTSLRQGPGAGAIIASDVIQEFAKQIELIPRDTNAVDLLVVSNGGDPTVAWRLISILRERFEQIGVLLPFAAFSAATLLALGANEIVMHPYANLGPVDPQLNYTRPGKEGEQGGTINFGAEDLRHFIEFVRDDIGISDQAQLERAFELICKDVGGVPIGVARRSSILSLEMGEKLLATHMADHTKAKTIAELLSKSFYHHGYPLSRSEAEEIGLPVADHDEELEAILWQVWEDIEGEMQIKEPFNPIDIVLSDADVGPMIRPVQQLQIPANLPQNILNQVLQQALQQTQIIAVPPVEYEMFNATVESRRGASEFRTRGMISSVRKPDISIGINMTPIKQGWVYNDVE